MADSGSLTVPLYTSPQEASVWDANEAYFQENKDALRDLLFRSAAEQNKVNVEMATHYIKKRNSWLKKLAKADGAANESTKVASVVEGSQNVITGSWTDAFETSCVASGTVIVTISLPFTQGPITSHLNV